MQPVPQAEKQQERRDGSEVLAQEPESQAAEVQPSRGGSDREPLQAQMVLLRFHPWQEAVEDEVLPQEEQAARPQQPLEPRV